jgi:hypothetical protein
MAGQRRYEKPGQEPRDIEDKTTRKQERKKNNPDRKADKKRKATIGIVGQIKVRQKGKS